MSELETKIEAEAREFTDELCDELSDEALDRMEGAAFTGFAGCYCGSERRPAGNQ